MTGILDHKRLRKKHGIHGCYSFSILIVTILVIASYSSAEVVKGRVTSAEGDAIELNLGSERGIRPGDSGRVYYTVTIDRNERAIYVAIFRITRVTDKSSTAQVHEKTTQVRAGLLVEVTVGEGELEIRSEKRAVGELSINTDPSGASIYFDGKSVGVSSYEAKDLAPRSYKIRISKEGYEVWEKEEVVETGKKTEVLAQLKAIEGTLEIVSEPSGAKVYIDGNEIGETPLHLASMRMGQYAIRVVMEGHVPYEQRVEVKGKDRQRVSALLKKIAGELIVRTEPPGADVFINEKPVGTTPYEGKDLPPGTYRVRIVKEGFGIWEGALTVISGRTVEVPIELKATEGGLEVKSEPSGAKVSLDGNEKGQTPLVLSGIRLGRHLIRVAKEEYQPYEEQIDLTGPEGKRVFASLRRATGEILVNTDPPGAIIYIDGKSVGMSPYEGKTMSPGSFRVRTMKEGYDTWERDVVIEAGKRIEVLAQLKAKVGDLEIVSEPPGAKVYVNRKEVGQTPVFLREIPIGQYLIQMMKEGYETREEEASVGEGERKRVQAALTKIVGELSIRTDPPGATIYIEGRYSGTSPYESRDLFPGAYKVHIVMEGYFPWEGILAVVAGKRVEVPIELKPRLGDVEILSEPPGAKVLLDGKEMGQTPLPLFGLRVGQHQVRVMKEGCESYEERINVAEGERKRFHASLRRIVGVLSIRTDPPGASVHIEGETVGMSPYESRDLPIGPYRVHIEKKDYAPWEGTLTVVAGKRVEVPIELKAQVGQMEVLSEPPGGKVFLDGKEVGKTPLSLPGLRAGQYQIRVFKETYEPYEEVVRLEEGKKTITALLKGADLLRKSYNAPVWSVGDRWTYRGAMGRTWSDEVTELREDLYVLSAGENRNLQGYDRRNMNCPFVFERSGRRVKNESSLRMFLDFPLYVGKRWKDGVSGYFTECTVEGVERVATAAGKFAAYKIRCQQRKIATAVPSWGWVSYWYSPEVKTWVKREFEKTAHWSNGSQDAELISYNMK